MDEQLVAFIDLLGFRSIITAQDDGRQSEILSLLTSLVEAKSDSRSEATCIDSRTREHEVWPAISAFSDNIVVSFTAAGLAHVGAGMIVFNLANNAAWIFSRAIRFGCLLRGGIAFGPLHHQNGVVFGPGLVEAYTMESKFAGRPRIIVSATAAQKLGSHPYLHSDEDGFLYLDYLRAAYDLEMSATTAGKPLTTRREASRSWIAEIRRVCEDEVDALAQTRNLAGLQNWRWFATRFERFVESVPPSMTEGT